MEILFSCLIHSEAGGAISDTKKFSRWEKSYRQEIILDSYQRGYIKTVLGQLLHQREVQSVEDFHIAIST